MRCGKLCRACGGSCFDAPTEAETIEIACPECEEMGGECAVCGGEGTIVIDRCPREFVGWDMSDAVGYAIHADKGQWPVAGGLLDQSWWFLELYSRFTGDVNRIEAEAAKERYRG